MSVTLAVLKGDKIVSASENEGARVPRYHTIKGEVLEGHCNFYFDVMGNDRCVFFAELVKAPAEWSIVTSTPLNSSQMVDKNDKVTKIFKKNFDPGCQKIGETTKCTPSKLLSVTDMNKDGVWEFIFTTAYAWDEGVALVQFDPRLNKAIDRFTTCAFCSD